MQPKEGEDGKPSLLQDFTTSQQQNLTDENK